MNERQGLTDEQIKQLRKEWRAITGNDNKFPWKTFAATLLFIVALYFIYKG